MIHNSIKVIASTMRSFGLASPVRCLIQPTCHIKIKYKFLCLTCNFVCVRDHFCTNARTREEGVSIQFGFGGKGCICPQTGDTFQFLRLKRKKIISRISLERKRASYIPARNQDKPMFKTLHPKNVVKSCWWWQGVSWCV